MKILVTGGTGNVGPAVVTRLVRHGHQVRVVGLEPTASAAGAEYVRCDVTDFPAIREQVRGCDAIAHLAAIPNPWPRPSLDIFRVNCLGTFHVFEAAAREGIKRVVCASSINALGHHFGVTCSDPCYLPVDEEHPTRTSDPYSFSKQLTEEIAAYYWRREGITSVCLRLPAVVRVERGPRGCGEADRLEFRKVLDALLAMPDAEREERVRQLTLKITAMRAARVMEMPHEERQVALAKFADPELGRIQWRNDFFAWISAEDSAQAFEKGLLADYQGSHALFVADRENTVGEEAELLARAFFPSVKSRKRPLAGAEPLVCMDKARQLIGYHPE